MVCQNSPMLERPNQHQVGSRIAPGLAPLRLSRLTCRIASVGRRKQIAESRSARRDLALHWLDVGCPDHLAPLLGFIDHQFAKVGG